MQFVGKRLRRKFVFAVLVGMAGLWLLSRLAAWGACSWYGYQTERDTRYASFIGCMVEVDGKWFPRSELRVVQ
ncbi:hypothetical protein D3C85_1760620 [compost metagenome]